MPFANNVKSVSRAAAGIMAIGLAITAFAGCSASRKHGNGDHGQTGATLGGSLGARKDASARPGVVERYMSEQAEALSRVLGPKTEQLGGEIRITWLNDELFDFDSAMLRKDSRPHIGAMSKVLVEYADTYILVAGHTDSEGKEGYNQKLSERRALSLRSYLEEMGVAPSRLETIGYGALRPVARNDTEEGRRENQRVEIIVRANEQLRQRAQAEK